MSISPPGKGEAIGSVIGYELFLCTMTAINQRRRAIQDINRILVVSRMTASRITAMHYGVTLAKKHGATLTGLHAFHDPFSAEGLLLKMPCSILMVKKKTKDMFA